MMAGFTKAQQLAWIADDDARVEAIQFALDAAEQRGAAREKELQRAIGNCYMAAKRGLSNGHKGVVTIPPDKMLAFRDQMLTNIMRFCESVGEKSDILRWQLPTEITDGEPPQAASSTEEQR